VSGIKQKLIKRLYYIVAMLLTIALALYPFTLGANVSELQEPTYSPDEDWSLTATSTQPDSEESLATLKNVATTTTIVPTVVSVPKRIKSLHASADKEYVVAKILEVFPDAPIMVQVASCESNINPLADRVTSDGRTGIDVGLFQINKVHLKKLNELGLDRYNIDDNLTYARMLYDNGGLGPWYMSRHCWS